METITNYLEQMFANLPNTEAVHKAKKELLSMMEDKYSELIAEGKSVNEAIGTVIAEFGNLDELAADLGLEEEIASTNERTAENPRRFVSMNEVKDYIASISKSALLIGVGVFLCITCVIWPILFGMEGNAEVGALIMFISIAAAVVVFIYNANVMRDWQYIRKTSCQIDMMTAGYVADERKRFMASHSLRMTVGSVLCILCWIPAAIIDQLAVHYDDLGGILLFLMVGIGVFLIISGARVKKAYEYLLSMNEDGTVSGTYYDDKNKTPVYKNKVLGEIMSVYWPTITAFYLMWSFSTFDWHISWIIWPVAAVLSIVIRKNFAEQE